MPHFPFSMWGLVLDQCKDCSSWRQIFPFTSTTSVSHKCPTFHFPCEGWFWTSVKAAAVDVKSFHSPPQQVFHINVPLSIFHVRVGSGPDAEAGLQPEAANVKCFHSSLQEMFQRRIPPIVFQCQSWFWTKCKGLSMASSLHLRVGPGLAEAWLCFLCI